MVDTMCRRYDVVTCKRRRRLLQVFLQVFITLNCFNHFSSAEDVVQLRNSPLGCVWRPKNASLFCLVFDANVAGNSSGKSDALTGVTRNDRDAAKTVELECFNSQENDLKKIFSTKESKGDRKSDDYLDDDDVTASQSSHRELWSQLQFIKVRGCPLHQVAVNNDDGDADNVKNDARHFPAPILRGVDTKSEDFFSDFFLPLVGGRMDWTRTRGLALKSSGLNRPLTTRTRTFCELSESLMSLDLSSNFYASIFDLFGSALKVSDKCSFAKLSNLNLRDNRIATIGANDFLFVPNLEVLDLSSNKIDRIESAALRHLSNLKTLHLSDNQLTSTSPQPWDNLTLIRELYLDGNSLDRAPDFSGLPNLVALNLSRNAITEIAGNSFGNLGELVALDLSHNRIVLIGDEAFAGLKSLQVLTLVHNRIQTISADTFSHLATLHGLLLSHNAIEHIHQVRHDAVIPAAGCRYGP